MDSSTTTATGGSDGFFTGILDSVQGTVKDLLPVWANNQLNKQYNDQLSSPTYDPGVSPPRVDSGMKTTGQIASPVGSAAPMNSMLNPGWLIAGGFGLVILAVVLARR